MLCESVGGTSAGNRIRVGVVGGGQLARMLMEAAVPLDVDVRVLCADADDGAGLVVRDTHRGSWQHVGDLLRLTEGCRVVTFDHELTPLPVLDSLETARVPLAPTAATMRVASHKAQQRAVAKTCGLRVPPSFLAHDASAVRAAVVDVGMPAVVKSVSGGYDGRGVWWLRSRADLDDFLEERAIGPSGVLVEPALPISAELATLVVRGATGERVVYPVVRTAQRDGICTTVTAPAATTPLLAQEAERGAVALADALDHVGVLAVEYFVVDGELVFNELAPRPHNSGHYTIDACTTSQFENHLRAALGWPLGDPSMTVPAAVMANVIATGAPLTPLEEVTVPPGTRIHLYGKRSAPGRKLGHVTSCGNDRATLTQLATQTAGVLARTHDVVLPVDAEAVRP